MFKPVSIAMVLALGAFAGCNGGGADVGVHGQVEGDDQPGTVFQGGEPAGSPERVRASRVESDGSMTSVAEGDVQADGSFDLDVPASEEKLVVETLDADNRVVAAALLTSSGEAGGEVSLPPMNAETTLEAFVFVEIVASGRPLDQANSSDLRGRLDGRVAAAAMAAAEANGDASAEIEALAASIAAAQEAEAEAWASAGVDVNQADAFEAELQAVAALDAALVAGTTSGEAGTAFFADLGIAAQAMGLTATQHAQATSQSTIASQIVLDAGSEVNDAAIRAAAEAEVEATAEAVSEALIDASETVRADAEAAIDALRTAVNVAATPEVAADAFAAFDAELVGDGDVSGSILGNAVGLDVVSAVSAQVAVDAALAARATLDAAVLTSEADIAELWEVYQATVEGAVTISPSLQGDADLSTTLIVAATGSFRTE